MQQVMTKPKEKLLLISSYLVQDKYYLFSTASLTPYPNFTSSFKSPQTTCLTPAEFMMLQIDNIWQILSSKTIKPLTPQILRRTWTDLQSCNRRNLQTALKPCGSSSWTNNEWPGKAQLTRSNQVLNCGRLIQSNSHPPTKLVWIRCSRNMPCKGSIRIQLWALYCSRQICRRSNIRAIIRWLASKRSKKTQKRQRRSLSTLKLSRSSHR